MAIHYMNTLHSHESIISQRYNIIYYNDTSSWFHTSSNDEPTYEPATIIIDNQAAISIAKCNMDTAVNCHVAQRYHYARQCTVQ